VGMLAARRAHWLCSAARGRSSVVERQLPKLNVVGSIPIARSSTWADFASAVGINARASPELNKRKVKTLRGSTWHPQRYQPASCSGSFRCGGTSPLP
jgi:hypothetical protein